MRTPIAFYIIVVLGLFILTGIVGAEESSEIALPLPAGTSVQSATIQQLGAAIGKAVRTTPDQAAAIVAEAIGSLTREDKEKAAAVITAALMTGKNTDILGVVRAAAAANPSLAPTVAATAARLFPRLAGRIGRAAVEGAPNEARAIALAVAAVAPDQREIIFAAIRSSGVPRLDLGALGFAIEQGINPANYVGGAGASGRPTTETPSTQPEENAGPTPSPTPPSGQPPPLGGGVISPES